MGPHDGLMDGSEATLLIGCAVVAGTLPGPKGCGSWKVIEISAEIRV